MDTSSERESESDDNMTSKVESQKNQEGTNQQVTTLSLHVSKVHLLSNE